MTRLVLEPKLVLEHPEIVTKLNNSRYKNYIYNFIDVKPRKSDILFLTSSGTEIDNLDQKYQQAVIFDQPGFEFSQNRFERFIYLSCDSSLREMNDFLDLLLADEKVKKLKKINSISKNTLKELNHLITKNTKLSTYYQRKLVAISDEWLNSKNIHEFYQIVGNTLDVILPKKMKFRESSSISLEDLKNGKLRPLSFGSESYFLVLNSLDLNDTEALMVTNLQSNLNRFFKEIKSFSQKEIKRSESTNNFHQILDPIVVCTQDDNIFMYNKSFLDLKLTAKDLLNLEFNQLYKHDNDVFHIQILNVQSYRIYQFKKTSQLVEKQKDQDLGIITSSIAHELNNPLAGILAAIEVLKLEDNLAEDMMELLKEMEQGARRSQNLTKTFLGFSRSQVNQDLIDFESVITRAYELVRFKEIENNIKLKFDFNGDSYFQNSRFNSSLMTMALYLILNDILLSYSRHTLVSEEKIFQIKINIIKEKNSISLKTDPSINLNTNLFKSRLLDYLLQEEKLNLRLKANSIILDQI